MVSLFLGLTALNLLCLAVALILGYAAGGTARGGWHSLAGTLATLVCCGVHCVVFTYFAATAKWVALAVAVKGLDPSLAGPTRSFRGQAVPALMGAIAATVLAACAGAAADNYHGRAGSWHHAFGLLALVVNIAVAGVEYRAIVRNGRHIDRILEEVAMGEAAPSPENRRG